MKRLYFTVTNDLAFDQRMQRICGSLAANGFIVTMVGRNRKGSAPLSKQSFFQHRIACVFEKGFLFYAEYNIRLFFYLFTKKMDGICAIDLDTILPCFAISKLKKISRIYDAHEYFTELKEVNSRPRVKNFWLAIERFCVPKFKSGYTVGSEIAKLFKQKYGVDYAVIRNMPLLHETVFTTPRAPFILYQGAVNEGRGFEWLIPAMQYVPYPLVVCGDGNFMEALKALIKKYELGNKVELKGMLSPQHLQQITPTATLGIGFTERDGLNQYLALPNKFFDYIHAGLPQLTMNFPEYGAVNKQFKVAMLLDDLDVDEIARTINAMMEDKALLEALHQNCMAARLVFNWQKEEKELLRFYHHLFSVA